MRELLVEVLEQEGYAVSSATGPEEALRWASAQTAGPDLVITDVVMPSMSGFSLAQTLRERYGRGIRVLFMSGYTDQALADRGELRVGDPFIRKPFSNDALLEKIREVLETDSEPGPTPAATTSPARGE
jgi:DNA-binding response OmpR family regulator